MSRARVVVALALVVAATSLARADAGDGTGVVAIDAAPPGAIIVVDGKEAGPAPARVTVDEGAHAVRARWPDGREASANVVVLAGGTASLRLEAAAAATPPPVDAPPPRPAPRALPGADANYDAFTLDSEPTTTTRRSAGLRPWKQMTIAGSVLFGVTWIGAIGLSAGFADYNPNASRVGYAPLGGPFSAYDKMNDKDRGALGIGAVAIGVVQVAGFALALGGGAWGIVETVKNKKKRAEVRR